MNITREQIDHINGVITIKIEKKDYAENVEKTLKGFKKTKEMPGFRKGFVPMELIKKQYGKNVKINHINEVLDTNMNKFISQEKLHLFDSPYFEENQNIDWEAEDITFRFSINVVPENISVNFEPKEPLLYYDIKATDKDVEESIDRYRLFLGKKVSVESVDKDSLIEGLFFSEQGNLNKELNVSVTELSSEAKDALMGKKVGDQVTISSQKLFDNVHSLMNYFEIEHDAAHNLDVPVTITIDEISRKEPAEINQEMFDLMFPKDNIKSEQELREKVRENAEKSYVQYSDREFLNEVYRYISENVELEIPELFIRKMVKFNSALSEQEIEAELSDPVKRKENVDYLKYQFVERKLVRENNLAVSNDDIRESVREQYKAYMSAYGVDMELTDKQVDEVIRENFKDESVMNKEVQRILDRKLTAFYKEKFALNKKDISLDEFSKELEARDKK